MSGRTMHIQLIYGCFGLELGLEVVVEPSIGYKNV
jgi:hypothetical protein